MKLEIAFLMTMLFFASMAVFLITHEGTHLFFAEEPQGICLGLCKVGDPPRTALGLAYAKNYPPESRNEYYANTAGIATATTFAFVGIVCIAGIAKEEKK